MMSLISRIISKLFIKSPGYEVSGYRTIYTAVVSLLEGDGSRGVSIGKTANYPRVEIHSIREQERLDKEGALRQINLTVESMSNKSLSEAVTMNEDNLRLLTEYELTLDGWSCLGIIPVQLQDLTETSDSNKIIYRLLQEVSIFLEKIKTEPEDETPTTQIEPDTETDDEPENENN